MDKCHIYHIKLCDNLILEQLIVNSSLMRQDHAQDPLLKNAVILKIDLINLSQMLFSRAYLF